MSLEMSDLFATQVLNINGQAVNLDCLDIKDIFDESNQGLLDPAFLPTSTEQGMHATKCNDLMTRFKTIQQLVYYQDMKPL